MRKRQRKKLHRYCCVKCRGNDGLLHHYPLKTGRWVSWFVECWPCDRKQPAQATGF